MHGAQLVFGKLCKVSWDYAGICMVAFTRGHGSPAGGCVHAPRGEMPRSTRTVTKSYLRDTFLSCID